jgi:hypothetical protein
VGVDSQTLLDNDQPRNCRAGDSCTRGMASFMNLPKSLPVLTVKPKVNSLDRISYEPYSETMTLLLFGGPRASRVE